MILFFWIKLSDFWWNFRISILCSIPKRATHKVPKLHLFKMKRKNRPPSCKSEKNTQLLHTGLLQGILFFHSKNMTLFSIMIRRSLRSSLWDAGFGNRSLIHKNYRVWFFLSWSTVMSNVSLSNRQQSHEGQTDWTPSTVFWGRFLINWW